jgi:hypothetical protein
VRARAGSIGSSFEAAGADGADGVDMDVADAASGFGESPSDPAGAGDPAALDEPDPPAASDAAGAGALDSAVAPALPAAFAAGGDRSPVAGLSSVDASSTPGCSSSPPPSPADFCLRAYATVRTREILDTLGVCFALAIPPGCHANAGWSK